FRRGRVGQRRVDDELDRAVFVHPYVVRRNGRPVDGVVNGNHQRIGRGGAVVGQVLLRAGQVGFGIGHGNSQREAAAVIGGRRDAERGQIGQRHVPGAGRRLGAVVQRGAGGYAGDDDVAENFGAVGRIAARAYRDGQRDSRVFIALRGCGVDRRTVNDRIG